jgi:endonuclease/exonuclease/phosphatase family metal-dependent hydrolase
MDTTLNHDLRDYFPDLGAFGSTQDLEQSRLYQELRPQIEAVLGDYELHNEVPVPEAHPFYRVVAWNVERGIQLEGINHILKTHPVLKDADVILATETDIGMVRSGNRNIAREMAKALGMNYFFAPSYINLAKGCGMEREFAGDNVLGIHGNAILSRYPIADPDIVVLKNAHDKMKGREKRLGSQRALIASIQFPQQTIKVACAHLDARSKQSHRAMQMKTILSQLKKYQGTPTIIGGDWNTSTYDSSSALWAILGFWVRVAMGTGNMIDNHYPYPDRKFEKDLFGYLEDHGFDYKKSNQDGGGTLHYSVEDMAQLKNLQEWIPNWCFRFVEWSLKPHGGECNLKMDWFATSDLNIAQDQAVQCPQKGASQSPQILRYLKHGDIKVSDHDAIALDFCLGDVPPFLSY